MYFELDENRGCREVPEKLEIHQQYLGYNDITTQYGRLVEKSLSINNTYRQYVLHIPKNNDKRGLLLFYHGSRGTAWMSALEYTRWIEYSETNNLVIAFGQASGVQVPPHYHPHYKGQVTHGELYYEIRDFTQGFHDDIEYTKMLIEEIKSQYNIDDTKIYFVGHSNGGVFGCLLPVHLPNIFRAVISHMGGIGHDPHFCLNFSQLKEIDRKTPILFYTGDKDVHKFPCKAAREIFLSENFPIVNIHIEENLHHRYIHTCEKYILDWISNLP